MRGKFWTIALVICLTVYPVLELSRLIISQPQFYALFRTDLELVFIWGFYLSMPFVLSYLIDRLTEIRK